MIQNSGITFVKCVKETYSPDRSSAGEGVRQAGRGRLTEAVGEREEGREEGEIEGGREGGREAGA